MKVQSFLLILAYTLTSNRLSGYIKSYLCGTIREIKGGQCISELRWKLETSASFGYWMRRQRKALDLTQQALADRVDYSVATIKKIEADERRPSRQMAERLADYLAIPSDRRERFIESARGVRPVDQMPLANEPALLPRQLSNLPRPLTSFIGRKKEIQQVKHLVSRARLVTIIGPGGVGKTRLAIQAAFALQADFQRGASIAELAALSDESLVPLRL